MSTDVGSKEARSFMARYFSMGRDSSVTSHEPHDTLNTVKDAYAECRALRWVNVEDYNRLGSVKITATDEGWAVAQDHFRDEMKKLYGPTLGSAS